ncbi:protein lava lamp [Stomoxys calcitrans]|uniref:protein lava lamp n=1 Tax=Stomoxys calcitrans TaxID=35570 RepID=UPI0027E245B0|nr:protein lava lamp [Stomoxys calcitrans]
MSSDPNEHQQQTPDITNLQESFLQQQEKISALKELVRKSGAAHGSSKTAAQEKVKHIAERLLKSKAKSKQGLNVSTYSTEVTSHEASLVYENKPASLNVSQVSSPMPPTHSSTPNPTPNRSQPSIATTFSTPGSEKIALMRQQLEQNKLRMAKKASSKQHLEQLVSQLKEKFDSTQQCLENTTELGRSMSDLSHLIYTPANRDRHKSATDLSSQNFSLEKERIKFLENRCRLLEKQLEKEKQSNNRSNNPVPNTADLERRADELQNELCEKERTFQGELYRLQSIIDGYEAQHKDAWTDGNLLIDQEKIKLIDRVDTLTKENSKLTKELEELSLQIQVNKNEGDEHLKKQLDELSSEVPTRSSDLEMENQQLKKELEAQLERIRELNETNDILETARCDLTSKATQLEEQIKQLRAELIDIQEKFRVSEDNCKRLQMELESTQKPADKTDTDVQVKAEMAKQIQELMDEVAELRAQKCKLEQSVAECEKLEVNDSSIAEKIASLEATVISQREDLLKAQEAQQKNEEELMEKTIELNVLNAQFKVLEEKMENSSKSKPLFSSSSVVGHDSGSAELEAENQQLKQKLDDSNKAMIKLKLKCKQTEKQIEKLKKGSDLHQEVVRLGKEKEQLQQKITELEDEKGQWQLTQVEPVVPVCSHDDKFKEYDDKIASLTAILEEKEKQFEALQQGEQSRVKTELNEVQLEEQVNDLSDQVTSLRNVLESKEKSLQSLHEEMELVKKQKDELDKKLEHYLNENLELLDKVEKLSKSSSSAESIEIVERLTHQEKQELEEFNKRLETGEAQSDMAVHKESINELTQTEMNPELTESLNQLREESSELISKIELFTNERREVLEKMENLTSENVELLARIDELKEEKGDLESKLDASKQKQDELLSLLETATREKNSLTAQIAESKANKSQLSQELTSLQQSSEVVAALDNSDTLFDKCEKSLCKLNCELEAYRKAHDKKSKFNVSKKLAKEAENAHTQLSELLVKVKEASSAVETVTVVETVVAVTAPNGKALAEYEQLTAQNRELKASNMELRRLLDEARYSQDDQADNKFSEERQAIASENELQGKLDNALLQNEDYETQMAELQSRVEDLRRELYESRTADEEKMEVISKLTEEVASLKKLSEEFDSLMNDKEMAHEKQVEQLTRLRKELESKCDTYEQEMEILQTLVTEQKQQLIEAYKEHEHEMNVKLLALQHNEEQVLELRQELCELKQASTTNGSDLMQELQSECDKLREALKINKNLVQEQLNELSNKQETIDTLNQQIIDLYKTMEDNATKIIEKEDEISYLQEDLNENKRQLQDLQRQLETSNKDLQEHLRKLSQSEGTHNQLEQRNKDQLEKLKKYAANLKKKALQCQELENKLQEVQDQTKELDGLRADRNDLQQQLVEARKQLASKTEEFVDLCSVRKTLEQEVKQLQLAVSEKESSIQALQANASANIQSSWAIDDPSEVEQLQQELLLSQEELRVRNQQLDDIKKSLSQAEDTISQLEQQHLETEALRMDLQIAQNKIIQFESELASARQETFEWGDNSEADRLREELICTQENLTLKTREIEELRQSLMAVQEQQNDWGNSTASIKNADYENLSKVLADKSAQLEKSESVIDELENELMTLREKEHESVQTINELRVELQKASVPAHDDSSELSAIRSELASQEQRLKEVSEELKAKSLKFEKSKAVIKERNGQIQRLQAQLKDLQEKLSSLPEEEATVSPMHQSQVAAANTQAPLRAELEALKDSYNQLNDKYQHEKANFQQTITRLETLHDGIQAKLQEDMSYIETLEQENAKFKDKIGRLEECVACFEERRASMERKVNIMDAQLQSNSEEHAKTEDELIYRLNMLSEHDEVIAQRLIESQSDKEEMEDNFSKLLTEHNNLQAKYTKLEREYAEFKTDSNSEFEQEMDALREQLSKTESELERQKGVYDGKLAAKVTELDELECELNEQLQQTNVEKRELLEKLERLSDDCAQHQNDILRLQENVNTLEQAKTELERETSWLRMQSENSQQDLYDLQELRMQSMQDKTEIENLRHQIESLSSNHENELQALRTQIAELDTLRMQVGQGQNQTDDQVFIETENKRLTDLLAEKEAIIENYQRQNLQLQMAAAAANNSNQVDPFALAFGLPPQSSAAVSNVIPTADTNDMERLTQDLNEKNALVCRLQLDLGNLQTEFSSLLEANQEMQRQINERHENATNVHTLQSAVPLTEAQPSDVIPAPPMFFTSETSVRSPFDDIMQPTAHSVDAASLAPATTEQPTIEDLQRNVSDLEKHAQDLEHKLVMRNQRDAEHEERLRDLESRLHDREVTLQQTTAELQGVKEEYKNVMEKQSELVPLQIELDSLKHQVQILEGLLRERNDELDRLRREHREHKEELQLKKTISSVEKQIVDPVIQPTLDMFFANTPDQVFEPFIIPQVSQEPVVEEIIVPKKVYDCHPEVKQDPISIASLDIGGDDWGDSWGNSEAMAEAEHYEKQTVSQSGAMAQPSLIPREKLLEIQMQELNERLQELQLALDRSEDQKKELHIKSGKLMKKLKEYKVKIDELQTSASSTAAFRKSSSIESGSMFDDLDAAIQDELKNQIKTLEAKLAEQLKVQEHMNTEKDKLLKRIDVLTAGNERITEMKERQDMEVQMYQARIKELQQKLQSLDDWGNDGNSQEQPETHKDIETKEKNSATTSTTIGESGLQQKLTALSLELQDSNGDRIELQALLEEEKANSQRAEKTIETLRQKLALVEEEKTSENESAIQLSNLRIEVQHLLDANKKLSTDFHTQAEILSLSQSNELRLKEELESLQKEGENLRETLANTKQSLIDLESELSSLKALKEKQLDDALRKPTEIPNPEWEQLKSEKELYEEQVRTLNQQMEELKVAMSSGRHLEEDQQAIEEKLSRLQAENDYLKQEKSTANNSDELCVQLQEKDSEILHLKQRINDLMNEDQTEKLVLEILTKNQEIQMLKMQVKELEEDKHELENNLSVQITKEMHANKEETSKAQMDASKQHELEAQIKELLTEKKQMEEELQVLNAHIMESLHQEDRLKVTALELDTKNLEISELRKTIETLQKAIMVGGHKVEQPETSVDITALNAQWQAVVEQRCGEIAKMWQEHVEQREKDFKALEDRLRAEISELRKGHQSNVAIEPVQQGVSVETTSSSTPVSESTTASGTTSAEASHDGTPLRIRSHDNEANVDAIMEQMQSALEAQEMEIVTLKEQLAIRSAEYARLAAQYDPFKLQNTSSHIGFMESRKSNVTADVATVPKSELDLALYMLHQRDMRCEEMTVELVSLLEERDTLQLKLSNTLRQMEAIKSTTQTGGSSEAPLSSSPSASQHRVDTIPSTSSVAGSTAAPVDDELSLKLSQLQTVSHAKDKVIKEEREQRILQMEKLKQDVAKMPPAAVSELTGSDMSQANQPTSNVLLNWLWGNKSGHPGSAPPDF